ncbi:unnamed protein product [Aureobasidium uvarum]|uniref:Uncharacterized protein n=1 Tax=Aureobasidium uvarum TaxID=2773716 RepID=A0A9N8PXG9_9PEZI|nr:unnamed protein product [Aureobasidium uvarum]
MISTNNAEKSTLMRQEMPGIQTSGSEAPVAKNNDSHITVSDIKTIVRALKRKRVDSAATSKLKEGSSKRQRGEKVGCLKVGTYSAIFEQKDLDESVTLKSLVNSNTELEPEDEDIWKVEDAKMPTRVTEKLPEEKYRMTQYSAWLEVLKEHDPEMMRLREAMIEDTDAGSPGLAADLPELEVLEPSWLYDYHLGVGTSRDAAGVDIGRAPDEEGTHVPDAEDEQSYKESED